MVKRRSLAEGLKSTPQARPGKGKGVRLRCQEGEESANEEDDKAEIQICQQSRSHFRCPPASDIQAEPAARAEPRPIPLDDQAAVGHRHGPEAGIPGAATRLARVRTPCKTSSNSFWSPGSKPTAT
jgi:hypothetical protein